MAIKRGGHSSGPLREGWPRRGSTGFGVGSENDRCRLKVHGPWRHHVGGELENQERAEVPRLHRRRDFGEPEQLCSLQQPGNVLALTTNLFAKPGSPHPIKEDNLTLVK